MIELVGGELFLVIKRHEILVEVPTEPRTVLHHARRLTIDLAYSWESLYPGDILMYVAPRGDSKSGLLPPRWLVSSSHYPSVNPGGHSHVRIRDMWLNFQKLQRVGVAK